MKRKKKVLHLFQIKIRFNLLIGLYNNWYMCFLYISRFVIIHLDIDKKNLRTKTNTNLKWREYMLGYVYSHLLSVGVPNNFDRLSESQRKRVDSKKMGCGWGVRPNLWQSDIHNSWSIYIASLLCPSPPLVKDSKLSFTAVSVSLMQHIKHFVLGHLNIGALTT
jgi:hypothetical protein